MKDPGKSASAKSLWPRIPKFVWFLVAFLTLPWFHYYRSIDGVVVDAETGEPIENVIVVAYWELKEKMFHNSESGITHISEVVTDSQGRFDLPGKLKLFPKFYGKDGFIDGILFLALSEYSPGIILFKDGYQGRIVNNYDWKTQKKKFGMGSIRAPFFIHGSRWDGQTLEISRLEGTKNQFYRNNLFLSQRVHQIKSEYGGCGLNTMPRMIIARTTMISESAGGETVFGKEEVKEWFEDDPDCHHLRGYLKTYLE